MNKIKMLKKLGFDVDTISDEEMKKELLELFNNILKEYNIDDKITSLDLTKRIGSFEIKDYYNLVNFCRGFDKKNNSYDFIVVNSIENDELHLIIRPTIQKNFNDIYFGKQIHIKYNMNNNYIGINKFSKNDQNLLCESNLYIRDSKINDLVLITKIKEFLGKDVNKYDARIKRVKNLREIYDTGIYELERVLEPLSNELFVTSYCYDLSRKLYINNCDTNLKMINGTTIYYVQNNKPYFIETLSNCFDRTNKETLTGSFNESYKQYIYNKNFNAYINGENGYSDGREYRKFI